MKQPPRMVPAPPEKKVAKQNLIERIETRFAEDERTPAVYSQAELVYAEVTVATDAKPGRREIQVITELGVSNALPFYVGQVPEVARKPMKTCSSRCSAKSIWPSVKDHRKKRMRITVPCTMNGQIAAGEVNRYRFQATRGSVWSSPSKLVSWSPTSPMAFPVGSRPC